MKPCKMELGATLEKILRYEQGELTQDEVTEMFAGLIRSGTVWRLQGSYGRTAADLINAGVISPKGEIL